MTRLHHRPRGARYSTAAQSQPVRTCPACGKRGYSSKATAKRAAKIIYPGAKMRVYSCPGTPWWHMTSQDAARTTEMRDRHAVKEDQ